jgi:hypothetical protein
MGRRSYLAVRIEHIVHILYTQTMNLDRLTLRYRAGLRVLKVISYCTLQNSARHTQYGDIAVFLYSGSIRKRVRVLI